jgi:C-terminal processing protease CtpA/Prc
MQEFFRRLDGAAARAEDDLDMVAAFTAHQPLIGITHFGFIRNPKIAATPIDSLITDLSANPAQWVNFTCYGTRELCYLRVSRWDRATPFIKRAFERADSVGTKTIIIDLVDNRGGDPSAMTPAAYLFRDSVTMGAVVGRPWYAAHSGPPTDAEMARFPPIASEEEAKLLLHIVRERGGAFARIPARQPYFGGTVYLLVNERTGSASEFLAHLLKSTARARLIGKRTAGAVLVALPHVVGDGFVVLVPEADYYARGTIRLEGRGVEPDLSTDDPHIAVGREIQQSMPFNALLFMARVYSSRGKYAEAERLWTEALALTTNEGSKRSIQASIDDARRRSRP